jgi:HK97 family phage prohead protease
MPTIEDLKGSLHKRERRSDRLLELRADSQDPTLRMFIPFDSRSVDMGFTEIIAPGAFRKTISVGKASPRADIVALWNHDSSRPLARQANGTLDLTETDTGLEARATLNPEIDSHREAMELVRGGYVQGSSFGFETIRDQWEYDANGAATRTLLEVKLYDVSPVTYPAYQQSEAEARSVIAAAAAASGVDVATLVTALRETRDGHVPETRRETVAQLVARLQALLPAPPVTTDWETRNRARLLRLRRAV